MRDPGTRILTVDHTVRSSAGAEALQMSRRIYEPAELERMLRDAGFASMTRFGDLNGATFRDDSRLIIVAKRQPEAAA